MTHVFVAPHPDDVALSCSGLIASLRELGQDVTILTVFSGSGATTGLTPFQREALGFGTKAIWPASEALNRVNVAASGAGDVMATRRLEDERFARFAEATIVWLDLPDAVFRGYESDDQLLGSPRADDPPPAELLAREITRLEPQRVYLPLAIGNHVDHQLVRAAGIALLRGDREWVMPGPEYAGIVGFYEDFPYAWWGDFSRLEDLPAGGLTWIPVEVGMAPEFAPISDSIDWKIQGIGLYESQLDRLFTGRRPMADAVRGFGRKVAALGGLPGYAERYWVTARL